LHVNWIEAEKSGGHNSSSKGITLTGATAKASNP